MGYYTKYDLEYEEKEGFNTSEHEILMALKTINPYILDYDITTNTTLADAFCEEMKWYDHEKDMIKLSEQFPDITFMLFGEGEESEDIWKETFKNGKAFYAPAKITFPEPPFGYFD